MTDNLLELLDEKEESSVENEREPVSAEPGEYNAQLQISEIMEKSGINPQEQISIDVLGNEDALHSKVPKLFFGEDNWLGISLMQVLANNGIIDDVYKKIPLELILKFLSMEMGKFEGAGAEHFAGTDGGEITFEFQNPVYKFLPKKPVEMIVSKYIESRIKQFGKAVRAVGTSKELKKMMALAELQEKLEPDKAGEVMALAERGYPLEGLMIYSALSMDGHNFPYDVLEKVLHDRAGKRTVLSSDEDRRIRDLGSLVGNYKNFERMRVSRAIAEIEAACQTKVYLNPNLKDYESFALEIEELLEKKPVQEEVVEEERDLLELIEEAREKRFLKKKSQEPKVGARVIIVKCGRGPNNYTYGGTTEDVPLFSFATIREIRGDDEYSLRVELNEETKGWSVAPSEIIVLGDQNGLTKNIYVPDLEKLNPDVIHKILDGLQKDDAKKDALEAIQKETGSLIKNLEDLGIDPGQIINAFSSRIPREHLGELANLSSYGEKNREAQLFQNEQNGLLRLIQDYSKRKNPMEQLRLDIMLYLNKKYSLINVWHREQVKTQAEFRGFLDSLEDYAKIEEDLENRVIIKPGSKVMVTSEDGQNYGVTKAGSWGFVVGLRDTSSVEFYELTGDQERTPNQFNIRHNHLVTMAGEKDPQYVKGTIAKKGDRIRISEHSEYYGSQGMHGMGTLLDDFGDSSRDDRGAYAHVRFDDGYANSYRAIDVEGGRLIIPDGLKKKYLAEIEAYLAELPELKKAYLAKAERSGEDQYAKEIIQKTTDFVTKYKIPMNQFIKILNANRIEFPNLSIRG